MSFVYLGLGIVYKKKNRLPKKASGLIKENKRTANF
jgi:hypothetical protein